MIKNFKCLYIFLLLINFINCIIGIAVDREEENNNNILYYFIVSLCLFTILICGTIGFIIYLNNKESLDIIPRKSFLFLFLLIIINLINSILGIVVERNTDKEKNITIWLGINIAISFIIITGLLYTICDFWEKKISLN